MNLRKVLFIGGDVEKLASVQIRCVDIATRLGCDYVLKCNSPESIPGSYSVFVCVKANLSHPHRKLLEKRGVLIWDIIDVLPPKDGVTIYLASTEKVKSYFLDYGRVAVIPHHHCNHSLRPNSPRNRNPGWIGGRQWRPQLRGCKFTKYYVQGMSQEKVVRAIRKIGIGLNFRTGGPWTDPSHPEKLQFDIHVSLNSGIKLINCIGFGIPSISGDEPAYAEYGHGCTIFSDPSECAHWVEVLRSNTKLYDEMRRNCIRKAKEFHIDTIAAKYKKLFKSL